MNIPGHLQTDTEGPLYQGHCDLCEAANIADHSLLLEAISFLSSYFTVPYLVS